jgi:hypothetical protein
LTVEPASIGPVAWDTSAEAEGAWTISATATDASGQATTRTLPVTVSRNATGGFGSPVAIPRSVPTGGSVLLAFNMSQTAKPIRSVVAVIHGIVNDQVTLNDNGTAGDARAGDRVWSASYTPRASGAYSVDLNITYEDNTREARPNAATFRVESLGIVGVGDLLPVLLLGALVVALGAFGIRRWK